MSKALGSTGYQDGMKIRLLRVARDITLTEFAERIGVTAPYLSRIERRHVPANVGLLVRIAREFGVPVDDLILRDERTVKAA
jgi:transcriptional regulator with XRE-family HTH domain